MAYQRMTRDEWQLLSNYGYGWEHEISEDTWKEMRVRLHEYRENCPQFSFKAIRRRVKIVCGTCKENHVTGKYYNHNFVGV